MTGGGQRRGARARQLLDARVGDRLQARRARRVGEHDGAQALAVDAAVGGDDLGPGGGDVGGRGLAGRRTSRASRSASMTGTPRAANRPATVDFPVPMSPVSPTSLKSARATVAEMLP